MQVWHCLLVLILPSLTTGHNPRSNSVSSNETKVTKLTTTFENVTVKFALDRLPPLDDDKVIGPNEIKQLIIKHNCKHELVKISERKDGNLELVAYYMCEIGNETPSGICITRILLISIMILASASLFYVFLRIKQSSSVDGEIRWRLWRVPQIDFMNGKFQNDPMDQKPVSHKYNRSI